VKITAIGLARLRLPLDPTFAAAWDPVPRQHFDATVVRVHTDEGITGYGSGDTMDGFGSYADLFIGKDPLRIAQHVRAIETIAFHAGRYWPLEAALWDIAGKACGQPVATLSGGARRCRSRGDGGRFSCGQDPDPARGSGRGAGGGARRAGSRRSGASDHD
jgi:D-galactarolactone cycloisomerase